jgi:hypothetical protein
METQDTSETKEHEFEVEYNHMPPIRKCLGIIRMYSTIQQQIDNSIEFLEKHGYTISKKNIS